MDDRPKYENDWLFMQMSSDCNATFNIYYSLYG